METPIFHVIPAIFKPESILDQQWITANGLRE